MVRVRAGLLNSSLLLLLIALPLGGQTEAPPPAPLCFTSGSATYRLAAGMDPADYTVRIVDSAGRPDLRMQLVDDPEDADFVLVDDFQAGQGTPCAASGALKTVKVAGHDAAADMTVSLSADARAADFRLYVHSARFSQADAAAILAVMWKADRRQQVAAQH